MREDDAFRLPGEDVRQCGTGGGFIFEGDAPVGRGFAVRIGDAAEFHHARPETAGEFCGLEVFDEVGEDEGAACAVVEDGFGHHAAAAKRQLRDVLRPVRRCFCAKVGSKANADTLRRRPLAYTGAGPGFRLRIVALPGGDMGVMDTVGRDEVAHRPECVNRGEQCRIGGDRRMAPQAAVSQAHYGHARAERNGETQREFHADDAAIGYPDVVAPGLQGVERLVEVKRCSHVQRPNNAATMSASSSV